MGSWPVTLGAQSSDRDELGTIRRLNQPKRLGICVNLFAFDCVSDRAHAPKVNCVELV